MGPVAPVAQLLREALDDVHAGRFGPAEQKAARVLRANPSNAQAHYALGLSALFQQRPADALAPLDRAAALAPQDPQYPFVRGMALAGMGQVEEAVEAYRAALRLRPVFFEASANLGNLLERNHRHPEAVEAYEAALRAKPGVPLVLNGLGLCLLALGDLPRAAECFARAVTADPNLATAHNNLGIVLGRLKRPQEAVAHLERAVAIRPAFPEAWINLGEQYYMAQRDADAVRALDEALKLDGGNAGIRHLRDSIAGVQTGRAPDEFIRGFFDRFAADFDKRLVGDLEYRTPQRMAEFLAPWLAGKEGALAIEDLGCGTGLSGLVLKPFARRLAGVDLSGKMLDKARERALYDELAEDEIARYLDARPAGATDLAAAMDVFVYIGDLDAIFAAVARSLAPGGLFAFSVERLEGEEPYRLARSGRYAHSAAYLRSLAAAHGLVEWKLADSVIRKEAGQPVTGLIAGFTRPA